MRFFQYLLLAWGAGDSGTFDEPEGAIRRDPSPPQIVAVLFGDKNDLHPIERVVKASYGRYELVNPNKIDVGKVADFLCKFL